MALAPYPIITFERNLVNVTTVDLSSRCIVQLQVNIEDKGVLKQRGCPENETSTCGGRIIRLMGIWNGDSMAVALATTEGGKVNGSERRIAARTVLIWLKSNTRGNYQSTNRCYKQCVLCSEIVLLRAYVQYPLATSSM